VAREVRSRVKRTETRRLPWPRGVSQAAGDELASIARERDWRVVEHKCLGRATRMCELALTPATNHAAKPPVD